MVRQRSPNIMELPMKRTFPLLGLILLISACQGIALPKANRAVAPTGIENHGQTPSPSQTIAPPTATPTVTPTPTSTPTSTQQIAPTAGAYGPDLENFPPGVNPLTGLPADSAELLGLPAVLISITNFPASARPQAGLSFAPWIWEIYIGEGMTRFLATFYGEEPRVEPPLRGNCAVRSTPLVSTGGPVLGNLVWLDSNGNGIQERREPGISGVCVTLYDSDGNILQTTSTDSNGYYGFEVEAGRTYIIGFERPSGLDFTLRDAGFDDADSDADPLTGRTIPVTVSASDLTWDAGYVTGAAAPTPTDAGAPGQPSTTPGGIASLPLVSPPQVGPIRSMRTAYENIRVFYPGGCLVAASGYVGVLAQVKGCKMVYGSDENDINSAMLDVTQIRELAEANRNSLQVVNYSGNVFDPAPPPGGQPASELRVFYSYLNQARWSYDLLAGAYARSGNLPDTPETFAPERDRLTGRQLLFENIILLIVEHHARSEVWIDIDLQPGAMGRAYLFRDGKMYPIYWSTIAGPYEQTTQLLRPVRFVDANRNPFPLKPGHTWVSIFTPASNISEKSPGIWLARFIAPKVP